MAGIVRRSCGCGRDPRGRLVGADLSSKPVRYVIPFDAGSSPDIVGRTITERLSRIWGQQVVVENRVGAAGTLGSAYVAKSPPDGYTLLQANIASNAIAVSLYAKMPYDQLRDFAPITRIGLTPNIILVHPSVPFKTVRQMVDYAKANPGQAELLRCARRHFAAPHDGAPEAATEVRHRALPYKIGSQAVTDTIGDRCRSTSRTRRSPSGALQGKPLRALAVTSAQRISVLPDVPTMQESGVPNFEVNSWYGLMAPASTPAAILDKINADMHTALRSPEVEKRMLERGDAAVADDATGVRSVRARGSRALGARHQGGGYPAAVKPRSAARGSTPFA
jgi:tripartite-type tricarboxylate transporter receptor subunit TctC